MLVENLKYNVMIYFFLQSYDDVRSLVSDEYELVVTQMPDVQTYAWEGGKCLAASSDFSDLVVTKRMYDEHGHNICLKKFNIDNE